WGRAYVDGSNKTVAGWAAGDEWLAEIVGQFHKVGIPVVYEDTPALFPDAYPMTDCALYYGWYAGSVTGPFARPDFHLVPGAIAVHIYSFSASTLRDSNTNWVASLVSKGAAASLGNVYEPYLQLTSRLDTFNDRLLHGFTFAESAYMATPALSWMSVMVGDPLYRPYASRLQIDMQGQSAKNASDWQMYREFAVKNRTCYTKPDDIVRVVLEESDAWLKLNKPKRALDLVRATLRNSPDMSAAPLLKNLEGKATSQASVTPTPTKP
ncbi:MAG: hypothetical protein DME54_04585, partial [Verrucomicrobia bacterium]